MCLSSASQKYDHRNEALIVFIHKIAYNFTSPPSSS